MSVHVDCLRNSDLGLILNQTTQMQTLDCLYLQEQTWPLIVFPQHPKWRTATADACEEAKEKIKTSGRQEIGAGAII